MDRCNKKGYYSLGVGYFEWRQFDGYIKRVEMDTDSDIYYPVFVHDTLCEYLQEKMPAAGLTDMLVVRSVLDDIILRAEEKSEE